MVNTDGNRLVVVATSIPPTLAREDFGSPADDYQALCIRSWVNNGFRILSINHPDEISDLAARYPEVTFIPTVRNASEWTGRKNPYIADLLLALKDASEPVLGIVNSDILFEPAAEWTEKLPSLVGKTMVVAQRYDTYSLREGAFRRCMGLDCFFFDKAIALAALEDCMPYAMGVPWWDYWLPCVALLNNRSITAIDRPAILHLDHRPAYSFDLWLKFAGIFAASLIRAHENTPYSPSEIIKTLMPCVRKMAAPGLGGRELMAICPSLGELFIPAIGKCAVSWKAADAGNIRSSDAATLTGIFERFDQRLISGNAIFDAKRLFKAGRRLEVQSDLIAAMNNTPDDPEVLAILGDLSFHRGDRKSAGALLAKSIDPFTDAIFPLQTLANVLWKCGRWEEALACYREILELDPEDQGAIKIAARLLWDLGRRREAVTFLKQALPRVVDLCGVAELYDHYRKIGSPIRNKYWQIIKRSKLPFLSDKGTNSGARWH